MPLCVTDLTLQPSNNPVGESSYKRKGRKIQFSAHAVRLNPLMNTAYLGCVLTKYVRVANYPRDHIMKGKALQSNVIHVICSNLTSWLLLIHSKIKLFTIQSSKHKKIMKAHY